MAIRFPHTKFIRSISTDCIKNYPNKNLPTIFVYLEGDLKFQLVGGHTFDGMNLRVQGKYLFTRSQLFGCKSILRYVLIKIRSNVM